MYYVFICFWLHWVCVASRGLSLVAASGGYSLVAVRGLLVVGASLVQSVSSRGRGLQELWRSGLVAPQYVEASWTRG